MERNMDFLIECMDDLSMEQQKVCVLFSQTFYSYGFLFDYHDTWSLPVPILLPELVSSTSPATSMASEEKVPSLA
jgi:hypothetical protein